MGVDKKVLVVIFFLIILIIGIIIIFLRLNKEDPLTKICTQVGCSSGISLIFSGEIPENLTIFLNTERYLFCNWTNQNHKNEWITIRKKGGINSISIPLNEKNIPKNFSIDVYVNRICNDEGEKIFSLKNHEVNYTVYTPNGKNCPPTCYSTKINISSY